MKTYKQTKRPAFANTPTSRQERPNRQRQPEGQIHPSGQRNLRIIPLGGLGEVGRNMMVLEYGGKFLIIDAGFRMPGEDMPGIDYIIPNTGWLKDKQKNILGAILTHGHYDHFGAIPYCWQRLGNPRIFTGKLAKGIIQKRQERFPLGPKLDITEINDNSKITLGPFRIETFRQNHNIPNNYGLLIRTPVGNIVHTSDFKFDRSPVNDLPTDFKRLKEIGKQGILLIMSDSTGAENEGKSLSERTIIKNLEKIFKDAKGRIISSTFASHLNRTQQIIALSEKYNRKVILEGLSMKDNVEIAQNLKYIKAKKGTFIKANQIRRFPDHQISIICTGAQGEQRATLMKIANGEYRFLKLKKGDSVVFSSSVIPGNERTVQFLKDQFYRQGANVFHYKMLDIHASGHAYQDELIEMIKIIRPKFFIPLHGQFSMLVKHAELAEKAGVNKAGIKVVENGQVVNINQKRILIEKEEVPANYVMVDGLGIGDVGEVVLRDRQTLSEDGMFVIVVAVEKKTGKVSGSPDIISRGFVYLRESKDLLQETRKRVIAITNRTAGTSGVVNWTYVKNELRDKIGEFLFTRTKRRPMILPVIIEV